MFYYPLIPTITAPTLSPIQEETEDLLMTLTPDLTRDTTADMSPRVEQRNNNTPLEPDSEEECKTDTAAKAEGIVVRSMSPQITPHFSQTIKLYQAKSDSRRNTDVIQKPETEVLKQKYINNDIRDIPCEFIQGPIRYGRLHRSRSQVNLASQDIRTQMTKLRTRNSNLRTQFRCSRLEDNLQQTTGKTLEELLNGDGYADDYDPELARLFDDYVEECDQITRGEMTSDTVVISRGRKMRDLNYLKPADVDTKEAFWRGFMEGMNHSKHQHDSDSDDLDLAIQMKESSREATHDPCMDKSSHVTMIRNNQDVTHKFLKEWEEIHTSNMVDENNPSSEGKQCFACNAEQQVLGDLLEKKSESESETKKDNFDSKQVGQRDLLPLGKTEINLEIDANTEALCASDPYLTEQPKDAIPSYLNTKKMGMKKSPRSRKPDQQTRDRKVQEKPTPKLRSTNGVLPAIPSKEQYLENDKAGEILITQKGTEEKRNSSDQSRKQENVHSPNINKKGSDRTLTAGPFMTVTTDRIHGNIKSNNLGVKDDMAKDGITQSRNEKAFDKICKLKNALDDATLKEYQFTDENISIITLAKLKLENRSMSSLALDSIIKSNNEWKRNQSPRCRSEDLEPDKECIMMKNIIRDLDLDGWEAKTKPFCDQDNLHMSSSELLHPVSSSESFSSPTVWRQSCSTPLLTSLDKKFLMLKSNDQTPAGSRTMTPERSTSTSAKLSDLEDGIKPKRKYETSAFKPVNYVIKNKITERVKLRLTKSCDNFVTKTGKYKDPAFTNVPLARCLSYNIEQRMKSGLTKATNINLSETLAKQLKDLGKDKERGTRQTPRDKATTNLQKTNDQIDQQEDEKLEEKLPYLDGKKLMTSRSKDKQDGEPIQISLPDIVNTSQDGIDEKKKDDKSTGNQTLPPISCTSLMTPDVSLQSPKKASTDNTPGRIIHSDEEAELWLNRSLPCRTESLQSPYTFDKADPSKLLLRAKALPHLHSVCTSCGGINERYENTSGHERAPPCGVQDKSRGKNVHHRCVTPCSDEKWRLDKKPGPESIHDLPTIKVSTVSDRNVTIEKGKPEIKKALSSSDYSKYERTKKHKHDEMTFKFLDKNIKLRFEVDLPDEDRRKLIESFNSAATESPSSRLADISKPKSRDKLECPIARETRIYKEKNRQKRLLQNVENGSRESPYLEYCKRKAYLQSVRESSHQENCTDLNTNTQLTNHYVGEGKSKRRQFPVIQAKTSTESSKRKGRTSRKQDKSRHAKERGAFQEKNRLCVEPGKLPTVKQEIQSNRYHSQKSKHISKDATNKKNAITGEKLPNINGRRHVTVDVPDAAQLDSNTDKENSET